MELSATRSSLATEGDDVIDLDAIATVHNATVQGAVVVVAMPKEGWSGCLLIHAHGFRAEGTHLHAEVDDPFWWRLIQQGANEPPRPAELSFEVPTEASVDSFFVFC